MFEHLRDAREAVQAAARYERRLWARPNQIEPEGTHRFSRTVAEHQAAVRQYLAQR